MKFVRPRKDGASETDARIFGAYAAHEHSAGVEKYGAAEIDTDGLWLESGFQSPQRLAVWLIAIGGTLVAFETLAASLESRYSTVLQSVAAGNPSSSTVAQFLVLHGRIGFCFPFGALLSIAFLVCGLMWVRLVVHNLPRLNARGTQFTAGRAVLFFVLPLASIVLPIPILQEVWRASAPHGNIADPYSWKRNRGNPLIGVTWFLLLAANFIYSIDDISRQSTQTHSGAAGLADAYQGLSLGHGIGAASHMLLILLVLCISGRQVGRYRRLTGTISPRIAAVAAVPAACAAVACCILFALLFVP